MHDGVFRHNGKLIGRSSHEICAWMNQTTACPVLVVSMELHHPLLQLASLIGGEAEITDVVGTVVILVVVPQLGLNGVGAQEGVSDERARQPT